MLEGNRPKYDGSSNYYKLNQEYESQVQTIVEELVQKTKVVFFSATPFAYHKSIKYVDGCLVDIEEKIIEEKQTFRQRNEATGFGQFLVSNFGYQMKYLW